MIQKAGKYRQVLGSSTSTADGLKTTLEMMTSHNPWTEFLSRKHRCLPMDPKPKGCFKLGHQKSGTVQVELCHYLKKSFCQLSSWSAEVCV